VNRILRFDSVRVYRHEIVDHLVLRAFNAVDVLLEPASARECGAEEANMEAENAGLC